MASKSELIFLRNLCQGFLRLSDSRARASDAFCEKAPTLSHQFTTESGLSHQAARSIQEQLNTRLHNSRGAVRLAYYEYLMRSGVANAEMSDDHFHDYNRLRPKIERNRRIVFFRGKGK